MSTNERDMDLAAARAVGLEVVGDQHPKDGLNVQVGGRVLVWRPRFDDGDAFRLANTLQMNVFHTGGAAYALPHDDDGGGEQRVSHRDAADLHAAMRLAIIRVAATLDPSGA